MTLLVHNKSDRLHRYPLPNKVYITWASGETKEVSDDIAHHVCGMHPDKMEIMRKFVEVVPEDDLDQDPPEGSEEDNDEGEEESEDPEDSPDESESSEEKRPRRIHTRRSPTA